MKKKLITTITLCIIILFSSCASKQKVIRERSESFIADINSFEVATFHLYTTLGMGKPKISDFYVRFAPRTNYLYAKARIVIDVIEIGFSYHERLNIKDAKEKYILAYESGNIPNTKPTKKNAISKGNTSVAWGSLGLTHEVDTTYITNIQYLEADKPYFRFRFVQEEEVSGENVHSPALCLYISPSQWEQIMEACNQEHLVEMTDEILAQAEAF